MVLQGGRHFIFVCWFALTQPAARSVVDDAALLQSTSSMSSGTNEWECAVAVEGQPSTLVKCKWRYIQKALETATTPHGNVTLVKFPPAKLPGLLKNLKVEGSDYDTFILRMAWSLGLSWSMSVNLPKKNFHWMYYDGLSTWQGYVTLVALNVVRAYLNLANDEPNKKEPNTNEFMMLSSGNYRGEDSDVDRLDGSLFFPNLLLPECSSNNSACFRTEEWCDENRDGVILDKPCADRMSSAITRHHDNGISMCEKAGEVEELKKGLHKKPCALEWNEKVKTHVKDPYYIEADRAHKPYALIDLREIKMPDFMREFITETNTTDKLHAAIHKFMLPLSARLHSHVKQGLDKFGLTDNFWKDVGDGVAGFPLDQLLPNTDFKIRIPKPEDDQWTEYVHNFAVCWGDVCQTEGGDKLFPNGKDDWR